MKSEFILYRQCVKFLGSGISEKIPIRIEPALFEWLIWYVNNYPDWMSDNELIAAGYNIDKLYKPIISRDDLQNNMKETCDQYYSRTCSVVKNALNIAQTDGKYLFYVVFLFIYLF